MASRRTSILHIPQEVLKEEIFYKLPIWSQSTAKCVCKRWHSILSTNPHLNRVQEEEYIVIHVRSAPYLLLYNITQGRWMKPWPLSLIPFPLKDMKLCGVFMGLFIFCDWEVFATWNVITNETSMVFLKLEHVPGRENWDFGALSNRNRELTLLVATGTQGHERKSIVWKWKTGDCKWSRCSLEEGCNLNFANLNTSNGILAFKHEEAWTMENGGTVILYDVEKKRSASIQGMVSFG